MSHVYKKGIRAKMEAFKEKTEQKHSSDTCTSEPYHGMLHMQQISGHEHGYGKPVEGSRTEYRGKSAGVHISSEIIELCDVIKQIGHALPNGQTAVTFGVLFETYTRISNKLVGMLMRARKQKLVDFEGEMLFQRRDDDVLIYLLQMPDELIADTEKRKEELRYHQAASKK